jgi:predicted RNase H-like HicB family nuclease
MVRGLLFCIDRLKFILIGFSITKSSRGVILMKKIAAYIEKDLETGFYVGIVPGIPGAHTQGETLDELQINLKEVLELCLEEMDTDLIPEFVGIQEIEVGK